MTLRKQLTEHNPWLRVVVTMVAVGFLFLGTSAFAADRFATRVGDVRVGDVKQQGALQVPYILWGGDVATFHANGGLKTKSGSVFQQVGLDLQLVPRDDFIEQVRRYMRGDSPFLRGTLRMIGLASEVIGSDPRTEGVVFLQMTWSAGDHMVGREGLQTLNDLRGKTIVLQQGGPHVGMLDDILKTSQLRWSDVNIVWVDDITGAKGPAERFRSDPKIDACCVITPDMIGLTGGLDSSGSGAEGTVRGAHVVVSTANMSRSIADVYVCRRDFFEKNRETVEAFAAGYLKGCEQLLDLKKDFSSKGRQSKYMGVLRMAQEIYGREILPDPVVDAHGLISDCAFVGLPGNQKFFEDQGFLEGFKGKSAKALELATSQGYAGATRDFRAPKFDYSKIQSLGGLRKVTAKPSAESVAEFPDDLEGNDAIVSFDINFKSDQTEFSEAVYGQEFLRAVEQASLFGNAVIGIRGHADPTLTLVNFIKAGLEKGILKRTGSSGNWRYFYKGRPLDVSNVDSIVELINSGAFDGTKHNPRLTLGAALNLSQRRAEAVRDAIVAYAAKKGITLNASQIQPVGVGIAEPLVPKPTNAIEAASNRRVEFRLIKVQAESTDDFDF